MAGDWIKMRGNLWDDPRVLRLCDLTDKGEAAIIGGLYWLWSTADQHTEDGVMPGLTLRQIDRKTGIQDFSQALCAIGWLADHPEGVRIVNFQEHNGSSAKRRATDAQRKASARSMSASDADKSRTDAGQEAPNLGAREEKRREEKKEEEEEEEESPRARAAKPSGFTPPDWINREHWDAWHSCAKRRKATVKQMEMAVHKLDTWRQAGDDYAGALENAAVGGWQGLFLPEARRANPADVRTTTVPSRSTVDPALAKINADLQMAAPVPAFVRNHPLNNLKRPPLSATFSQLSGSAP